MAGNYKHAGLRIPVKDASAAITNGKPCVQEGFFGIAMADMASGAAGMLGVSGVWNIPVPASTVKGDILYVPSAIGGTSITENADVTGTLTRTSSNANSPVAIAVEDRRADGTADVLIGDRIAARAATQV